MALQRGNGFDQISMMFGELKGSVAEIEKYVHEGRHGINNLSQKLDGMAVRLAADLAAVEARMDSRLRKLEESAAGDQRARNITTVILQSPVVAWLFAIAVVLYEAIKGGHR